MSDSKKGKAAAHDAAPENDPEIEALLDFEPVPRKFKRKDGWTAALQRKFIAALATTGSPQAAADSLGKNRHGVEKLYKSPGADGFRAAWDSAIALFEERAAQRIAEESAPLAGVKPPFVDRRSKLLSSTAGPLPGQVMNEHGQWEDEKSLRGRAEEAKDSICEKLLRARRLFLAEISGSAGKRAAFEILTQLPIDWDKAKRLEPQPDEPWKSPNQRQPDMVLTAENGWTAGQIGYGPDKMRELMQALNDYREEEGLERVEWSDPQPECGGHSGSDHEDAPTTSSPTEIGDPPSRHSRESGNPASKDRSGPRLRRI